MYRVIGTLVAVLFWTWVGSKIYTAFFGPLAKVPGPAISRWTHLGIKRAVMQRQRLLYIHDLHQKYGPIVRLSPWEVSIADYQATRDIHAFGSGFLKSDFYTRLIATGADPNVFAMKDPKDHSQRRRILASELSESMLKPRDDQIFAKVHLSMNGMKKDMEQQGVVDVFKWNIFMATDVIGELSFGEPFRMLEKGSDTQYTIDLKNNMMAGGFRSEFPIFTRYIMPYIPTKFCWTIGKSGERLTSYAQASIDRYKSALAKDPQGLRPTLFSKLFTKHDEGTLTDAQVRSESTGYIVAGSDTTAVTLTYLMWSVLRHPAIHQKLVAEVSQLPEDFSSADLRDLPYLNKVIHETLRLYGAAPGSLPRVVPAGGRKLAGYYIPEGIVASTHAWTLHRDEKIFPDPYAYEPSRWDNPTEEMEKAFMPFGGGGRICIGLHLAKMELRAATAHFFRTFPNAKIPTPIEAVADDMEVRQTFLMTPKNKRCMISNGPMAN